MVLHDFRGFVSAWCLRSESSGPESQVAAAARLCMYDRTTAEFVQHLQH